MKHSSGSGHYLIDPFCEIIDTLQAPLKVIWISGHSEVQGNKEADNLVKRAMQGQSSPPLDLPLLLCRPQPHSTDAEKQLYTQEIKTMWSEQWNDSPRCTHLEHIDKSFPLERSYTTYQEPKAASPLVLGSPVQSSFCLSGTWTATETSPTKSQ